MTDAAEDLERWTTWFCETGLVIDFRDDPLLWPVSGPMPDQVGRSVPLQNISDAAWDSNSKEESA